MVMKPFFVIFFVSSTKTLRRRTLVCSTKTLVSNEKLCLTGAREGVSEGRREGGNVTNFCQKLCLTVPYNFLEDPSCVRQTFWYRKKVAIRNGRVSRLSVKLFCLTVPNRFAEESFCVLESFGYRKTLGLRGEYHDFL